MISTMVLCPKRRGRLFVCSFHVPRVKQNVLSFEEILGRFPLENGIGFPTQLRVFHFSKGGWQVSVLQRSFQPGKLRFPHGSKTRKSVQSPCPFCPHSTKSRGRDHLQWNSSIFSSHLWPNLPFSGTSKYFGSSQLWPNRETKKARQARESWRSGGMFLPLKVFGTGQAAPTRLPPTAGASL